MSRVASNKLQLLDRKEYWAKRLRQWLIGQSEVTRRNYEDDIKDFVRWLDAPLDALFKGDPELVAKKVQMVGLDYIEDLRTRDVWSSPKAKERGDEAVKKGLATATIQRRVVAFRAVVQLAVEAGYCPRDVHLPSPPKVKTMRDTSGIGRTDFLQLLDTLDARLDNSKPGSLQHSNTVRDTAVLLLLHDVGLRLVEVLRITIEEMGWSQGQLTIQLRRKGDAEDERRPWPIAEKPAAAIQAWLRVRGNPISGPLITNRKGRPLTSRAIQLSLAKLSLAADVGHVHPHKLRHTAVNTLAHLTNGNLPGMQQFAGHADPKTTMKYVHGDGEEIRQLQRLLGGTE